MSDVELDVVIPALREQSLEDALWSLAHGTVRPDLVTLVSNEASADHETYGLNLRILRFRTDAYAVGESDVALRRNIGIWASPCSHVLTFDDDELAPATLVAESLRVLATERYFWGHYRFVDIESYGRERLLELPPEHGEEREHPPNAWHFWLSCYGGLFGAERRAVIEVGGYDMAFSGRHGGEDQNFGRRLARALDDNDMVFVHEPPFAWHPTERVGVLPRAWSNVCGEHRLVDGEVGGSAALVCADCPYFRVDDADLRGDEPLVQYEHDLVELDAIAL